MTLKLNVIFKIHFIFSRRDLTQRTMTDRNKELFIEMRKPIKVKTMMHHHSSRNESVGGERTKNMKNNLRRNVGTQRSVNLP